MGLDQISKIQTEMFINLNMAILSMMSNYAPSFENPLMPYTITIGILGKNIGQLIAALPKNAQNDMIKFANRQIIDQMQAIEHKPNIHIMSTHGTC